MRVLMDHAWPGNVRELRNAIEHALVKSRGPVLMVEDLPRELLEVAGAPVAHGPRRGGGVVVDERARVLEALERAHWNRTAAARALGIDRSTLWRRMRKLDVSPER
jgi:transcriptional regulator of acetoin/glycerol metabolism